MRYNCYKCKKDITDTKDKFIAESGEYLCSSCSIGAIEVDKELLKSIDKKIEEGNWKE